MPYITIPSSEYHIDNKTSYTNIIEYIARNYQASTITQTYYVNNIFCNTVDANNKKENVSSFVDILLSYKNEHENLYSAKRESLYQSFTIPKKNGGFRTINAPHEQLKSALDALKDIFEKYFYILPHQSAYAYTAHRNAYVCLQQHQLNNSKWFTKFDFSDFFGNITKHFAINMMKLIFPLNDLLLGHDNQLKLFDDVIDICFLNNSLPQGSPTSPMISNIVMIPIDYCIDKYLRDNYNCMQFVYTRYADDIIISSPVKFNYLQIQKDIVSILKKFHAPFTLNYDKTRYGSSYGSNWNLGLMLNRDNKITIGYKNKKFFKAKINNYIYDKARHIKWEKHDVEVLAGLISYYKMVEKDYISYIINHYNAKYNVNIADMIYNDLHDRSG